MDSPEHFATATFQCDVLQLGPTYLCMQADRIVPTLVDNPGPYSVPPAPAAPSGDQASIESFGEAVPFTDSDSEPVTQTTKTRDSPPGAFGTFLAATDGVPAAPVINQAHI